MDRLVGKGALRGPASEVRVGDGALAPDRPLGVYVHFPFCGVRCPYCDFAVDTRADVPHDVYADAVIAELGARRAWFTGDTPLSLRSIYFGGGTPGLWRADAVARVLAAVTRAFPARGDAPLEITLEANPGEIADAGDHLAALRAAGVNRLSIGVQSFDDRLLASLGRNHDAASVPRAVGAARAAGFDNLSCDLMYGLPGQTMDDWRRSLDALIALEPEHVSAYALTIERGTPFGSAARAGRLACPPDDVVATHFEAGRAALERAGFTHYEISSHARPGRRAVHNTLYWTGGAYLGLGASASSFRPLADGRGVRFSNPRATDTYLRGVRDNGGAVAPAHAEVLDAGALEAEALWLGLRLVADGVDRRAHAARHGIDPLASPTRLAAAARCEQAGWLFIDDQHVRLTRAGSLYADEVAARLWDV